MLCARGVEMDNKLKVKDLVTIGIFTVIYFVGMYLLGMIGMIPILFALWPTLNGIVMGVVVMLFMAKVQKPWGLFIMGVLPSVIMFAMGHTIVLLIHGVLVMLAAEFIRRKDNFQSFPATALANGVFSMWACGSLVQILFVRDTYLDMTTTMMGEEYATGLANLVTVPNMALIYLGAFAGGILGAFLGKKMLKKHFEKVGIA